MGSPALKGGAFAFRPPGLHEAKKRSLRLSAGTGSVGMTMPSRSPDSIFGH